MARQYLLNAFRNINQLSCLSNSKILYNKRGNISAELLIREGKYKLRIDIKAGKLPNVYVVEPEIDRSNPLEIHTFGFKYHPYYKKELPLSQDDDNRRLSASKGMFSYRLVVVYQNKAYLVIAPTQYGDAIEKLLADTFSYQL